MMEGVEDFEKIFQIHERKGLAKSFDARTR